MSNLYSTKEILRIELSLEKLIHHGYRKAIYFFLSKMFSRSPRSYSRWNFSYPNIKVTSKVQDAFLRLFGFGHEQIREIFFKQSLRRVNDNHVINNSYSEQKSIRIMGPISEVKLGQPFSILCSFLIKLIVW